MGRPIRCLPEPYSLVEVTCRTLQGRFLLRPSPQTHEVILGILARGQRLYPLDIHAFIVMSNHMHLLVTPCHQKRLSDFVRYVKSNIAREVGRIVQWNEKLWGHRYKGIPVSTEEAAQVERLRYLLSHGVKEGLVDHPGKWHGLHSIDALLSGEPLVGLWFNRTEEYSARTRRESFDRLKYATQEVLKLSPLPCWKHLSEAAYRRQVADLVEAIEKNYAPEGIRRGKKASQIRTSRPRHPHHAPNRLKKSPSPRFHAASRRARRELMEGYSLFLRAYRAAAERLRAGLSPVAFPLGSFPPPSPFVQEASARAP